MPSNMNDPDRRGPDPKDADGDEAAQGPNLVLLYSLIALAMAVAIGLAALIVLPFYIRR
jgi:hypothetical protein